uniref:Toxin Tpa8 n=1 Tax=Tityus pachyurus TaxID=288781 RepID=SCX8_TITPA|nr:RecName: Full=Toxin Tpa8; AltName: Full=T NaTx9.1; Flags: Precursor [Tityus pachyurus]CCD31437.1 scorpion toxin Tpa8 precursor [Tityus pachyurus]
MVKSEMKLVIFSLFLLLIGVESLKNGYPVIEGGGSPDYGESAECGSEDSNSADNFCNDICTNVGGKSGDCCLGSCFCFDLPDEQKTVEVMDRTKEYCEFVE